MDRYGLFGLVEVVGDGKVKSMVAQAQTLLTYLEDIALCVDAYDDNDTCDSFFVRHRARFLEYHGGHRVSTTPSH